MTKVQRIDVRLPELVVEERREGEGERAGRCDCGAWHGTDPAGGGAGQGGAAVFTAEYK